MLFKVEYTTGIHVDATHVCKFICKLVASKHLEIVKMAKTVRLSESEQELIRRKAIEINKILVGQMKQPLKDSELVHAVLELAMNRIEVSKSGLLILN